MTPASSKITRISFMTRSATLIRCSRAASTSGERQRVLDEATVFQILLPPCDHVTALVEIGTQEVAVGERLFGALPRLDIEGRLPPISLVIAATCPQLLARVCLDERPISRRAVACSPAGSASSGGFDATQLALVDKILKFLVGRTPSGVGLFADPVD